MKTSPLEHQKNIQPVISNRDYYGLLWDQGTGKTWPMCWLLEKEQPRRALIMSPNNVTDVWVEQIAEHTNIPERKIKLLTGTKEQRRKALSSDSSIFIINYEGLRTIFHELNEEEWDVMIADESQRIKNFKALQTRAATALSQRARKRFILSGTPFYNYLDVFSQFLFLDQGERFGSNFYAFRNKYFYDENSHRWRGNFPMWKIKPGAEGEIKRKIASCCHRLDIKSCIKLPPIIPQTEYVYLTPDQQKCYKELAEEFITTIDDKAVTAAVMLTRLIRFRQVTSGFLNTEEGVIKPFKQNPKLDTVLEMAERILPMDENGKWLNKNKLIIWALFRYDIELLAEKLKKYNPVIKYGGVKGPVHRKFQDDDNCKIFIGQPHSAGTGTTLTKGNYMIRYSYDYSAEDKDQSDRRNWRKGSEIHESIVHITIKAKHTIDETTIKNLSDKNELASSVMEFIKKFGGKHAKGSC